MRAYKEFYAFVRANIDNSAYTFRAMERMFGKRKGTIHEYLLRHLDLKEQESPQTHEIRKIKTEQDRVMRIGKRVHRQYEVERMRALSGLSPATKRVVIRLDKKAYNARTRLISSHKYYRDETDEYALLWDKDTKRIRCAKANKGKGEQFYTDKYGFKFYEAED